MTALETVPDFPTSDGDFGLGDGAFVSSYFKTGENDSQNGMTKNSSSCQLGTNSQSFELDLGGQTKNYPDHGQLTRQDSQGFEIGESFENLPEDKTNTYETINSGYNEEKIKLNYGTLSSQPNEEGAATQESAMNFMQSLVKGKLFFFLQLHFLSLTYYNNRICFQEKKGLENIYFKISEMKLFSC